MSIQQAYVADQQHLASKNLQTPVSFIGSYKMIMPMAESPGGTKGWVRALRATGVVLLLALFWLIVTVTFYAFVFASIVLGVVWVIYTLHRRHQIQAARRTLAGGAVAAVG